jgi:SRSO17 transposase
LIGSSCQAGEGGAKVESSVEPILNLPEITMRVLLERAYQGLKQDFGAGALRRSRWRGFHRHAGLRIAAYEFLMAERLSADKSVGDKERGLHRTPSACRLKQRAIAGRPRR